ncbi:hypothetical protein L6452_44516 [Arctium lappa]|uniref:Uncharacterized protein n=1 Tax=Arctium lappa TaxID=4217 RepID=A0ACB8XGE7_ARCLA|nr:hypothetical protein L6452_44516 [Arctium lappa]
MTKRRVVLKREEPPPPPSSPPPPLSPPSMDSPNSSNTMRTHVRYGECQRNHAANIGGYAVDGCREFMSAAGEAADEDEETEAALTCAACGCHRNFHRRVVETMTEASVWSNDHDWPSSSCSP